MGSRRSRRANGRVQAGTNRKPSGIAKARKHAARQQQKAAILSAARTARKAAKEQPPHLLAVLALTPTSDDRLSALTAALSAAAANDASRKSNFDAFIVRRGVSERETLLAALDAAKLADSFLLVFEDRAEIDGVAVSLLDALRAQGIPTVNAIAIGEGSDDADLRKLRGRQLAAESLGEDHVLRPLPARLDSESDAPTANRAILRRIFAKPPRAIAWRRRYGYLHVKAAETAAEGRPQGEESDEKQTVPLALRGWIRGRGFSPNELVHLTGLGSFAVKEIADASTGTILAAREESNAEPVESEAELDETMGEQTWPPEMDGEEGDEEDDDDDDDDDDLGHQLAREYDVAADRDNLADERGDGAGRDGNTDGKMEDADGKMEDTGDGDEWAELLGLSKGNRAKSASSKADGKSASASVAFSAMGTDDVEDMTVDEDEVARIRAAARTDSEFPDEVDTPINQPARTRFARYRGLKSLRTGEWDPKELLPREYATLFQFRDLGATRKRILARARREAEAARAAANGVESGGKEMRDEDEKPNFVLAGREVVIRLQGVPLKVATEVQAMLADGKRPVVASGMLRHENRRSVVHFAVRRVDSEEDDEAAVVKAKSHMEMHAGFVRFEGRPMFSEHNANSDKHKMERFLRHGRLTVASFYGPAVYAPAPALLCWPGGKIVAAGGALGADPDRIMLKRIILTGYPFKTQKRRAVVKFMFFSPEDVRWFKPVELWTKLGRSGHIIEPLGTHGHMKCMFDNVVLHHDTVCMTLYKRVYPKLLTADDVEHGSGNGAPTLTTA